MLPDASQQCSLPQCPLLSGQVVAVVGGGLTAAQLALLALKHGASQVHIIMRSLNKVCVGPCCSGLAVYGSAAR